LRLKEGVRDMVKVIVTVQKEHGGQ
jgi:hypothetical protein